MEKYLVWKNSFDGYLSEMIEELQADYLDGLRLKISINDNYLFNGAKSRWLAVYEKSTRKITEGIISIGFNYPLLYQEMCKSKIDKDEFNIEAQARITVGHEVGHGLVDYIKLLKIDKKTLKKMPSTYDVIKASLKKEELLAEEFGEYQFPDATGTWCCDIINALDEISELPNQ